MFEHYIGFDNVLFFELEGSSENNNHLYGRIYAKAISRQTTNCSVKVPVGYTYVLIERDQVPVEKPYNTVEEILEALEKIYNNTVAA